MGSLCAGREPGSPCKVSPSKADWLGVGRWAEPKPPCPQDPTQGVSCSSPGEVGTATLPEQQLHEKLSRTGQVCLPVVMTTAVSLLPDLHDPSS